MKNYFKYICLAFAFGGMVSCADVLDIENLNNYSPDNVWNDEKLSNAYLSNLYSSAFSGWPINCDGLYADETGGILPVDYVRVNNDNCKYWPYSNIYKNKMLGFLSSILF